MLDKPLLGLGIICFIMGSFMLVKITQYPAEDPVQRKKDAQTAWAAIIMGIICLMLLM